MLLTGHVGSPSLHGFRLRVTLAADPLGEEGWTFYGLGPRRTALLTLLLDPLLLQATVNECHHFLFPRVSPSPQVPPGTTMVAALCSSSREVWQPGGRGLVPVLLAAVRGRVGLGVQPHPAPGLALVTAPAPRGVAGEAITLPVRRSSLTGSTTCWWRRGSS